MRITRYIGFAAMEFPTLDQSAEARQKVVQLGRARRARFAIPGDRPVHDIGKRLLEEAILAPRFVLPCAAEIGLMASGHHIMHYGVRYALPTPSATALEGRHVELRRRAWFGLAGIHTC